MNNELKRAYRLWWRFKTQCAEYAAIAARLGVTRLQLNSMCHDLRRQKEAE